MKLWHKIVGLSVIALVAIFLFVLSFHTESRDFGAVSDQLNGKSYQQKVEIKSVAIVSKNFTGTFTIDGTTVEVQEITKISGGIQILARAWQDGEQLGFGPDGSVEIERFKIYNPPIMVPDGTKHTVEETLPNGRSISTEVNNYKEDPIAAIQQSLIHIIEISATKGAKIVPGKVGNTTSTFYPNGNTADGGVSRGPGSPEAWTTIRSSAGTAVNNTGTCSLPTYIYSPNTSGDTWGSLYRGSFVFDTSPIEDTDTISSAIFSLFCCGKSDTLSITPDLNIYGITTGSDTNIVAADYNIANWGAEWSTAITYASWSTVAYNDFALNGTGVAAVSKTGMTKIGTRNANYDIANVAPTHSVSGDSFVEGNFADTAGTASDPILVVTHTCD